MARQTDINKCRVTEYVLFNIIKKLEEKLCKINIPKLNKDIM